MQALLNRAAQYRTDSRKSPAWPQTVGSNAEILRTLVERITVRSDANGHVVVLTGDIVKLLALPGGKVPSFVREFGKGGCGGTLRPRLEMQLLS